MDYLMWMDLKTDAAHRIRAAVAAAQRQGRPAALVLVAPGEGAAVEGIEVREARAGEPTVRPGIVMVGGEQ